MLYPILLPPVHASQPLPLAIHNPPQGMNLLHNPPEQYISSQLLPLLLLRLHDLINNKCHKSIHISVLEQVSGVLPINVTVVGRWGRLVG